LRPAKELIAGNGNMKNSSRKIPDFETIIQKMTKFSKKVEKSRFFSVTNQQVHSLYRKKVVPMGR